MKLAETKRESSTTMVTQLFCGGKMEAQSIAFPNVTRREAASRAGCQTSAACLRGDPRARDMQPVPRMEKDDNEHLLFPKSPFCIPLVVSAPEPSAEGLWYSLMRHTRKKYHFSFLLLLGSSGGISISHFFTVRQFCHTSQSFSGFLEEKLHWAEGKGETSPLEPSLSLKGTSMSCGFRSGCVELAALIQRQLHIKD